MGNPGWRLQGLIAVHLLLSACSSLGFLFAGRIVTARFLPLLWIGPAVWIGQLMLLALWLGMGGGTLRRRLTGSTTGCAFMAIWPSLTDWATEQDMSGSYPARLGGFLMLVAIWAAVFGAIRHYRAELRRFTPDLCPPTTPASSQFSILQLLIVTSLAAVILGLSRSLATNREGAWFVVANYSLMIVIFCINLYCTVWAALNLGRVAWRLALVCLVSLLLGTAMSFASGLREIGLWPFAAMIVVLTIPTIVVALSLLVMRSCGYRLVPRGTAGRARLVPSSTIADATLR